MQKITNINKKVLIAASRILALYLRFTIVQINSIL